VPYDEELAERIRELVCDQENVSEQRMFGGLAFLVGGNMAVAASGRGGLMVRVEPARGEKLIAAGSAEPMEMRGRPMTGWLRVASDAVRTKRQLTRWVELGTSTAASLPPKVAKRR
jgi:TfoX/Sxy family transcriptional regulator of competence genes